MFVADSWSLLYRSSRRNTVVPDAALTVVLWVESVEIDSSHNNIVTGLCVEAG
jgi:hypothetical protein